MNRLSIAAIALTVALTSGCIQTPSASDAGSDGSTMIDGAGDEGSMDAAGPEEGDSCGGCGGATPVCDTTADTCVECLQTTDCDDGVCDTDANRCVDCVGDEDCDGVCDTDANTCVGCQVNEDCTEPSASLCDASTNTCTGCTGSEDCGHLADTTVCDTDEATCVECTGTEYDACDGVCDSRQHTCTDRPAGELGLCEACVSDAECREGMVCVAQMFEADDGSGPAEVGTFCFWERDAAVANAPDGACGAVPPYIEDASVTTIDGLTTNVCGLAVTTCSALKDYRDKECSAPGEHQECGADGFDDGLCVAVDAQTNKCTTPCLGDDDCKAASACDDSIVPDRCTL